MKWLPAVNTLIKTSTGASDQLFPVQYAFLLSILFCLHHNIGVPCKQKFTGMIIVYILGGLILLLLLAAAMMPKLYSIERTEVIKKSPEEVMRYISDLNKYALWNPWQQAEPAAEKNITGTPGTPGHRYAWKGKKIGVGHLTLNRIDEHHIHFDLEFLKPWKSKAKDNWHFEPWGDGRETKVTWQNSGNLPWPMARLMGPVIHKNLHHQFGKGLENLKSLCEA